MLINITKINLNPNSGGKPIELETKEITITENGTTTVTPSEGFGGLSSVEIDVYIENPSEEIDFSEIGYDATDSANAIMPVQVGIEYAKQMQTEYTDDKIYKNDKNLVYFPLVDTSNRTSCFEMFRNCGGLLYVPPLTITNKCTDLTSMFQSCPKLTSLDLSSWNTSNVTTMYFTFSNCSGLTSLDLSSLNTSNVTNMSYMFQACSKLTSLDLSSWNTSNVTTMYYMFETSGLTSLDLSSLNTSNVTTMGYMFSNCSKLTSLDLSSWNTSNVTNMGSMFNNCPKLTSLDLSSWNVQNVTNMNYMFYRCSALTNFQAPQNINTNIDFSSCNNLTVDSLLSILNNLTDKTGTTSPTCKLGVNLEKLTDEQKAIATSKNWVLS